jgi:hypothetical protein
METHSDPLRGRTTIENQTKFNKFKKLNEKTLKEGHELETVQKWDEEWSEIEFLVHKSLPTHEIYSLERVINPLLTSKFEQKKEELEKKGKSPNIIFGFRSSFGKNYEDEHRNVCSEGHVLTRGDYGLGIYFAEHAIYPTYLFRNNGQSPKNQIQTVIGPDADGSGSMEMIVSELLLGDTFDYGNELSPHSDSEYDPHFQEYDSIQGTENYFGVSKTQDIINRGEAQQLGWTKGIDEVAMDGPRTEALYYAKNPFDIENGRQYVFNDSDKCNPRFIVNIRPKVSKKVSVGKLDLRNMIKPKFNPQVLMFQNKIIAEINGQRVIISDVNNIGYDYLKLGATNNTIGLVDPGRTTPRSTVGGGYRKKSKKKNKSKRKKKSKKKKKSKRNKK